jgi:hypothetical protein
MKKLLIVELLIIAIFFVIITITFNIREIQPVTVKRSVPQGDFVRDTRSPIEACNSTLPDVQASSPKLKCRLIDSKRIDSHLDWVECVDGASVAGCFACTIECK